MCCFLDESMASDAGGMDSAKMYMWIKGLESKVNTLLREVDILKNDFLNKQNTMKKDLKVLNQDLLEMKRQQDASLRMMDLMIQELKKTAGAEEVTVLKKYMEYWNPLTFVTQRDLERALASQQSSSMAAMVEEKNK